MIIGFTLAQLAVAVVVGLVCITLGLIGRKPNDLTLAGSALITVLLLAQLVVAILAPGLGNPPTGNLLEYYIYLISAILIPPLATVWGLVERTRWSTVVIGVGALAVAVMLYRMQQIWTVQGH